MDEAAENSTSSKRRRGIGFVTRNACSECRKKRSKCDGKEPSCTRCDTSGISCCYESPVRQSKNDIRNEVNMLKTYRNHTTVIFETLATADEHRVAEILERLKLGEAIESIGIRLESARTQRGESSQLRISMPSQQTLDPFLAVFGQAAYDTPSISLSEVASPSAARGDECRSLQYAVGDGMKLDWESPHYDSSDRSTLSRAGSNVGMTPENLHLPQAVPAGVEPIIGNWMSHGETAGDGISQRDRGQQFLFGPDSMTVPDAPQSFNTANWTAITDDVDLMDHLLALYFCWEYPTFASISKEHFLIDYRSGSTRFCSSLLVNALLALGSRFTDIIEVRGDALDGSTAGDVFYTEALRLLSTSKTYTLPTVQALGLLSIREASCGFNSDSWFHSGQSIRMACEMGLHRVRPDRENVPATDLEEVQTATFWGAFSLNICWSVMTGCLPHYSRDVVFLRKPSILHKVESIDWVPYTDDGMPLERNCTQTSNIRTVYRCFCELSETLHHSLYIIYSPRSHLTSARLVGIYTTFLNWYDSMPEALRLGENFTPAVLFAHMYYHTVVLHLFRPFIKTRLAGSTVCPRDICLNASDSISNLVRSYSQLYTLRRTPSLVPYIVFSATLTYAIIQGSSPGASPPPPHHHDRLVQGIRDLRQMSICHGFARISLHILRFFCRKWAVTGLEAAWDDCDAEPSQLKGVAFSSASMNFFCPDLDACREGLGDLRSDCPLFSVFHKTGLPLVPQGEGFREAGFQMLGAEADG